MQTMIDLSALNEEFFISMLNSILEHKKKSKK